VQKRLNQDLINALLTIKTLNSTVQKVEARPRHKTNYVLHERKGDADRGVQTSICLNYSAWTDCLDLSYTKNPWILLLLIRRTHKKHHNTKTRSSAVFP
jgi:hypothetical protein